MAVQPAPLGVLLEPAAQPRPLPQQRLVGDLRRTFADADQAAGGQHVEHARDVVVSVGVELVERHQPANRGAADVLAGETQQDAARHGLLARIEAVEGCLGQSRHRAAHAAGLLVSGQTHRAGLAPLPELDQRGGQQRQRAGLTLDVGEQAVDELGLDVQACAPRGTLDRPPQLVALHRSDEDVVGTDEPDQVGICRAVAVEVGANGEDHAGPAPGVRAQRDEGVDERGPLVPVATQREALLELVDRDEQAIVRRRVGGCPLERPHGVFARAQQQLRPVLAVRQRAAGERRQQARAHGGRFAAARRAHDGQQRRAGEPGHHVGDQALAPEEELGVTDVERRQSLVGAHAGGVVGLV